MIPYIVAAIGGVAFYLARRMRNVPNPPSGWKKFKAPGTVPLDAAGCRTLEGLYSFAEGGEQFGEGAVLKWSYTVEKGQVRYYLSLFCGKGGTYMICEGRRSADGVLLKGYWRSFSHEQTGIVHLQTEGLPGPDSNISIRGFYGRGAAEPSVPLLLNGYRPLPRKKPIDIIAHRGGARNVDFLPVSENSLEMLRMAAPLGATGVEIDVRLTKDEVPVLVHDSFLSLHTTKGALYGGIVSNHTLAELQEMELRKGGTVPTLREALTVILEQTPLQTVWLDIKFTGDLEAIRLLQQEFMGRAAAAGRTLYIYIGIPDKKVKECFLQLDGYHHVPSLTELEAEDAETLNAQVWAPQYTKGVQTETVEKIQAQGRKAFVWSLDDPAMIEHYLCEGGFNGIVTNVCPAVVYNYYTLSCEKAAG